jgi:hypothetical protein
MADDGWWLGVGLAIGRDQAAEACRRGVEVLVLADGGQILPEWRLAFCRCVVTRSCHDCDIYRRLGSLWAAC